VIPVAAQTLSGIVTLIAAAAEKPDGGWFDSSVAVAVVGGISALAVAWFGYMKTRPPPPPPPSPPDLAAAAAARVAALKEYGAGQDELLRNARRDLESAAGALRKRRQRGVRSLALELAVCTDLTEAARLRDQIVRPQG
jgi:hypothetical protein